MFFSKLNGEPVSFYSCPSLESLYLGRNIINSPFRETTLTSVTISNSVTSIEDEAFRFCSSLTSVTIPESVTSIGERAFSGCSGLTSVTIPSSVTTIVEGAFSGCSGLTSVTIPSSVTSIGEWAFSGCSGLTSVAIPSSVTSIGNSAFQRCSGLTSVTIPSSVTSIGGSAFYECSGLTSVTIPNSVTTIGQYAFFGCSGLTSVAIPNSVTSIDYSAFEYCSGLTSVTIPNSVTSIGDYAFRECRSLTSVFIGNSVETIGGVAFALCTGLTDVYAYTEKVPETFKNAFWGFNLDDITLHVPAASIEDYKATEPWSGFGKIVAIEEEEELDIAPMEKEAEVAFDGKIDEQTDLKEVVIEKIFITLSPESGDGYLSDEGCIMMTSTVTEEQMDAVVENELDINHLQGDFKGFVLRVPAGKGTVGITAQTVGNRSLRVRIGEEFRSFVQTERGTVEVPYVTEKDLYVYIYGGEAETTNGKHRVSGDVENAVKIYSVKWTPDDASSVNTLSVDQPQNTVYYTLDGRRAITPQKGLNVLRMSDGTVKTVLVK